MTRNSPAYKILRVHALKQQLNKAFSSFPKKNQYDKGRDSQTEGSWVNLAGVLSGVTWCKT